MSNDVYNQGMARSLLATALWICSCIRNRKACLSVRVTNRVDGIGTALASGSRMLKDKYRQLDND